MTTEQEIAAFKVEFEEALKLTVPTQEMRDYLYAIYTSHMKTSANFGFGEAVGSMKAQLGRSIPARRRHLAPTIL